MLIIGKLKKAELLTELNRFIANKEIKSLAKEHGIDEYLFNQVRFSTDKPQANLPIFTSIPFILYLLI